MGTRAILELEVPVPMRDGVILRANVWRPDTDEPVPAILLRTPYLKEYDEINAFCEPRAAVARGFAVVSQDVRSRGTSEGTWTPYLDDLPDGYDTIEHVAALDWCNGDVVTTGCSYDGATQWLAALTQPPSLRAIAPGLTPDRYDDGWTYRGGVLELEFIHSWLAGAFITPGDEWLDDVERSYTDRPALLAAAPYSRPWFEEPPGSDYWAQFSPASHRERIGVPAFNSAGWYDIFLEGALRNFRDDPHPWSRLVIGPWGHDDYLSHLVGSRNLGIAGSAGAFGFFDRQLDFYAAVLKGEMPPGPRVSAYVMGARRWVGLDTWPPPDAVTETLAISPASFTFDPDDPTPSKGGRCLGVNAAHGLGWGQFDQTSTTAHPGVVRLDLPPLEETTTVAGPVSARLQVEAEGDDSSDWVATLCLVEADGQIVNLTEGIARAASSAGEVTVALGDTCILLPRGTRLCLLVSGSSYPRWEPLTRPRRQHIGPGSLLELSVSPAACG